MMELLDSYYCDEGASFISRFCLLQKYIFIYLCDRQSDLIYYLMSWVNKIATRIIHPHGTENFFYHALDHEVGFEAYDYIEI